MNNKIKLNTLAFITIIFWSAAYPLTKVASQDFDCYTITALRAFIAAALMLIIGLVTHIRKIFSLVMFGCLRSRVHSLFRYM